MSKYGTTFALDAVEFKITIFLLLLLKNTKIFVIITSY